MKYQLHNRFFNQNFKETLYNLTFYFTVVALFTFVSGCIMTEKPNTSKKDNGENIVPTVTTVGTITPDNVFPQRTNILFEGEITLIARRDQVLPSSMVDLDMGEKELVNENGDIKFVISGGTSNFYLIKPVNGALGYYNANEIIEFETCKRALASFTSGSIPEFLGGKSFCILTNMGRMVSVKYEQESLQLKPDGETEVTVTVVVWKPKNLLK